MKSRDLLLALGILGLLGLAALGLRNGSETVAGGVRVIDGDTLEVAGRRLRLRGLDAPEMAQVCTGRAGPYPCGAVARDALREIVSGAVVVCRVSGRDRWGRGLAACTARESDLGAELVRHGLAVAYGGYLGEEREARRLGRGLWAGTFQRPDEWRREHAGADRPSR